MLLLHHRCRRCLITVAAGVIIIITAVAGVIINVVADVNFFIASGNIATKLLLIISLLLTNNTNFSNSSNVMSPGVRASPIDRPIQRH
jgi:hypothetical protein